MSNLPVLIPETVETKPLLDHDILVLDYANKTILVYDNQDFELMLDFTKVDVESILTCIEDHHNLGPSDPIYAINGFTFMLVKDFVKNPIQCGIGTDNPSIPSSKLLFHIYFELKNELIEVLNIETGEITKYFDLDAALINLDVTYYDLLKFPVKAHRVIGDITDYVFPVVRDNYIFRIVRHPLNWTTYSHSALEPSGLLTLEEHDSVEHVNNSHQARVNKVNLLDNHPDGLGKHIKVYRELMITEEEVKGYWDIDYLPLYIEYKGYRYLTIIGSDLLVNFEFQNPLPIELAVSMVHGSSFYLDQVYEFLGWDKKFVHLAIIGHKVGSQ